MPSYDFPKEVSVLSGRHMHRGDFNYGAKSCLLGWCRKEFHTVRAQDATCDAICQAAGIDEADYDAIANFNDSEKNSLALLARTWNRAMASLGYTVGNPEA